MSVNVSLPKAVEVVAAVSALTDLYGWPPTIRELGKALGLTSSQSTWRRVNNTIRLGWVEKGPATTPRTLRVTEEGRRALADA